MIVCSTVRGARLTLCTVQVIDLEDFLAVAPCADLTIHSVARRKGTLVRSGVTVSVGRDEPRCTAPRTRVDRGGEFAQASVASSSSADACATCSFSPRPFSLLPLSSQLVDSSRSCRHRSGTGFGSDGKVRTHVLLASGGLATPGPSTGSWRPSALVLWWFGPLQRVARTQRVPPPRSVRREPVMRIAVVVQQSSAPLTLRTDRQDRS